METPVEYQKIVSFLVALDEKLTSSATLYVIGGSAVTLAYYPDNRTSDIDVIGAEEEVTRLGGSESGLARKFGVHISEVSDISFAVPDGWRNRCQQVELGLKKLIIKAADPYDIILGKLARFEPKDIDDLIALKRSGYVDAEKLIICLNNNLKEVKRTQEYRQNVLLLFNVILKRQIAFKAGKAYFI